MNCLDLYRLIYDNATTWNWSGSLLQCTILHCRSHVVPGTSRASLFGTHTNYWGKLYKTF
jgi:hypothetical protein